jgi:hypothetical protein
MNQEIRRELIGRNLGIRPINHGQIYTFQIALPDAEKKDLPLDQHNLIERSLLEHQSNLVSLIVRRTTAYNDEDIEYEVVYGSDWFQVAKDLNIEMLWAWVFDMTDEQAQATKAEMQRLFGLQASDVQRSDRVSHSEAIAVKEIDIEELIDRKLKIVSDSIKQLLMNSSEKIREDFNERIKLVHHRLDGLNNNSLNTSALIEQIKGLRQQLELTGSRSSRALASFEGPKLDLRQAQSKDIGAALEMIGTQDLHIQSALNAIAYWKQPNRELTWSNLKKSAQAQSEHKIKNFADKTLKRLHTVGEIPDSGS